VDKEDCNKKALQLNVNNDMNRDGSKIIVLWQLSAQKKKKVKGHSPMKRSRASYTAVGTPVVVKNYRAQLAAVLKRRGVSLLVPKFFGQNSGNASNIGIVLA
jgi:hypothetical protein